MEAPNRLARCRDDRDSSRGGDLDSLEIKKAASNTGVSLAA